MGADTAIGFHLHAVGPHVLVLRPGAHHGARLLGAELGDDAVQQVDLVEEVDRVHRQPLVLVLALRQRHRVAQIAGAERRLRVLVQVVPLGPDAVGFFGLEGLRLVAGEEFADVHRGLSGLGLARRRRRRR